MDQYIYYHDAHEFVNRLGRSWKFSEVRFGKFKTLMMTSRNIIFEFWVDLFWMQRIKSKFNRKNNKYQNDRHQFSEFRIFHVKNSLILGDFVFHHFFRWSDELGIPRYGINTGNESSSNGHDIMLHSGNDDFKWKIVIFINFIKIISWVLVLEMKI